MFKIETYCFLFDMGKKKDKQSKKDKYLYDARFRSGLHTEEQRDMMERYGIDRTEYSPNAHMTDRVHGKKSYEQLEKDLVRAASSDYHTNRAIEAAALSGNEDAQEWAKNGFKSMQELEEVQNMQRKWHKDAGNGGSFSSESDFAGLSYGMVEQARETLLKGLDEKYAKKQDEAPKDPADDIGEKAEVVLSNHMERAKNIVEDWEQGDQKVYADNSGALTQATGIKETEPPSDVRPPSSVPVDLTDPDTFFNNKMNVYKSRFNFTPDF